MQKQRSFGHPLESKRKRVCVCVCMFGDECMARKKYFFHVVLEEVKKEESGVVKVCGVDIQVPPWLKYSSKPLTLGKPCSCAPPLCRSKTNGHDKRCKSDVNTADAHDLQQPLQHQ